jgi:ribosomal protein L32
MEEDMSITLHKRLGVNPRLTICPNCGEDGNGIVLLGHKNKIFNCKTCGINLIGNAKCPKCGFYGEFVRELNDHEKVVDISPCSKCQEVLKKQDEWVEEGGVLFRCTKCGTKGAINKSNPICKEVRDKLGVEPPNPCAIEFNECPECEGR